jgi:hypothetical protein
MCHYVSSLLHDVSGLSPMCSAREEVFASMNNKRSNTIKKVEGKLLISEKWRSLPQIPLFSIFPKKKTKIARTPGVHPWRC